ncbi:MAG: hypothetical protein AAF623_06210 [Planctomycetota bacterium]
MRALQTSSAIITIIAVTFVLSSQVAKAQTGLVSLEERYSGPMDRFANQKTGSTNRIMNKSAKPGIGSNLDRNKMEDILPASYEPTINASNQFLPIESNAVQQNQEYIERPLPQGFTPDPNVDAELEFERRRYEMLQQANPGVDISNVPLVPRDIYRVFPSDSAGAYSPLDLHVGATGCCADEWANFCNCDGLVSTSVNFPWSSRGRRCGSIFNGCSGGCQSGGLLSRLGGQCDQCNQECDSNSGSGCSGCVGNTSSSEGRVESMMDAPALVKEKVSNKKEKFSIAKTIREVLQR